MMNRLICGLFLLSLLPLNNASAQASHIDRLAEGVYATVARPEGDSPFNTLFWVGNDHVAAVGSCLDSDALEELTSAIAAVSDKPLRYCILAPSKGASFSDPPPSSDLALILDWRSWQALRDALSPLPFSLLYFRDDPTFELAGRTVNLIAAEKGGDVKVFLPEEAVLYIAAAKSSDCSRKVRLSPLRKRSYPWQKSQQLGANIIVPACGSLVNSEK